MQTSWRRFAGRESLALILFAILLAWQVLLPGFIGLANNGDFSKIAGRLRIGGEDEGADNFLFFKSDYVRAERYWWDSGLPSSELLIARTASGFEKLDSWPPLVCGLRSCGLCAVRDGLPWWLWRC
jgi:hypothetical protein